MRSTSSSCGPCCFKPFPSPLFSLPFLLLARSSLLEKPSCLYNRQREIYWCLGRMKLTRGACQGGPHCTPTQAPTHRWLGTPCRNRQSACGALLVGGGGRKVHKNDTRYHPHENDAGRPKSYRETQRTYCESTPVWPTFLKRLKLGSCAPRLPPAPARADVAEYPFCTAARE